MDLRHVLSKLSPADLNPSDKDRLVMVVFQHVEKCYNCCGCSVCLEVKAIQTRRDKFRYKSYKQLKGIE